MSIQGEIARIADARDDALDAVAAKGVTVPAGSTIDDLPSLIAAIPTGGGATPKVIASLWATGAGTSYAVLGTYNNTTAPAVYTADSGFCSCSNFVFTFTKAGQYKINYFGRGGYNSSGTSIRLYYRIMKGQTELAASTNVTNTGISGSVTATLAAGDTIHAETRNKSGSNTHDFGFWIEPIE